jgi:hypothetical protein
MKIMTRWSKIPLQGFPITALSFLMFGCSVTETINDFLSSTTPGVWFTGDGLVKEEYQAHVFVAINFDNPTTDLTEGYGEYMTSLTALLHVSSNHQPQFFAFVQRLYPDWPGRRISPGVRRHSSLFRNDSRRPGRVGPHRIKKRNLRRNEPNLIWSH